MEPTKCNLFKPEVKFLGHVVSAKGIHTDPDKVAAVAGWLRPQTLKEPRRFLGFCSYYRRFFRLRQDSSSPSHKLLGQLAAPKGGKCVGIDDLWDAECEVAFGKLKAALTTAPVLGYVDFKEPFILETDASQDGLGAILSQKQNGMAVSEILRRMPIVTVQRR